MNCNVSVRDSSPHSRSNSEAVFSTKSDPLNGPVFLGVQFIFSKTIFWFFKKGDQPIKNTQKNKNISFSLDQPIKKYCNKNIQTPKTPPLQFQELETVLKGRLHQAVTLAQLGQADRWPRIKQLAEDVLQLLGGRWCLQHRWHVVIEWCWMMLNVIVFLYNRLYISCNDFRKPDQSLYF